MDRDYNSFVPGFSGIILAGGKNSRMAGVDKAFLKINGKPIILKILDIFKEIFEEIWIITNSPESYLFIKDDKISVARDILKENGPLGGIYTGLKYMKNEAGFFVACDMPNLHIDLIKRQLQLFQKGGYECLAPLNGNYTEPLHAIYTKQLAERIYSFMKEAGNNRARGVKDFLKTCNCLFMKISGAEAASFHNLNTFSVLEKYK